MVLCDVQVEFRILSGGLAEAEHRIVGAVNNLGSQYGDRIQCDAEELFSSCLKSDHRIFSCQHASRAGIGNGPSAECCAVRIILCVDICDIDLLDVYERDFADGFFIDDNDIPSVNRLCGYGCAGRKICVVGTVDNLCRKNGNRCIAYTCQSF